MKKIYSLIFTCLICFAGYSQEQSKIIDKISTQLSAYYSNLPSEKIYFQTDKDVYSPGEIIWFSAKVFDRSTQTFSNLNSDLTLKIFDNKGSVIESDMFLLEGGKTSGDIKLPETLTRGRYYIAAYTSLQFQADQIFTRLIYIDQPYTSDVIINVKNAEKIYSTDKETGVFVNIKTLESKPLPKFRINYEVYFDTERIDNGKLRTDENGDVVINFKFPEETGTLPLRIVVSDEKNTWEKTILVRTQKDIINVEFFAEGGNFIAGFPQKVGFVAKDIFGKYIKLDGDIVDGTSAIVAKSQSFTDGFGLFPIQLKEGENYRFIITSEYGKGQVFDLPVATANKPMLSVVNTDKEFIYTNITCPQGSKQNIVLTVTSGYRLLWSGELTITGPSRFKIPIDNLPDGLVLISAFDQNAGLLGQRVINIDRNKYLDIKVNPSVENDKIRLSVAAVDENNVPVNSDALVSVASANNVLDSRQNLYCYFRFNSELVNTISNPADIITAHSFNKTALDYILIANGMKGFSWDNILNFNPSELKPINNNQLGLSGKVTGKYKLAVPGAKISIFDTRSMQIYSQTADSEGKFFFPSLNPVGIDNFTITATDQNGKKEYTVVINKTFDEQLGERIRENDLLNATIDVSRENMLDFLKLNTGLITDPPKKPAYKPRIEIDPPYKKMLKNSTSILEVIKTIKPFQINGGQIVFSGMTNSINNQSGAIIVVDGQKLGTSASILDNYSPLDIEEINVFTDPVNTQKYTSFASAGLIEIFTKKATQQTIAPEVQVSDEKLYKNGYRIPRDYNSIIETSPDNKNNLSSTLFWNPVVPLEKDAPVILNVPFSGLKSDFIISVESIDNGGRIGIIKTKVKR